MSAPSESRALTAAEIVTLAEELRLRVPADERLLLGVAGPPGAGKSTLAAAVVGRLNARQGTVGVALVGMDGFHLADPLLDSLGRLDRKGAPDTFDVDGYVELLQRLRRRERTVYAPRFDRDLEAGVVGAVEVRAGVGVAVTEGNYLLLEADGWQRVRAALHWCGYVQLAEPVRRERLRRRHETHGRSPAEALARTTGSDEDNARLIATTRHRADALVVA